MPTVVNAPPPENAGRNCDWNCLKNINRVYKMYKLQKILVHLSQLFVRNVSLNSAEHVEFILFESSVGVKVLLGKYMTILICWHFILFECCNKPVAPKVDPWRTLPVNKINLFLHSFCNVVSTWYKLVCWVMPSISLLLLLCHIPTALSHLVRHFSHEFLSCVITQFVCTLALTACLVTASLCSQ